MIKTIFQSASQKLLSSAFNNTIKVIYLNANTQKQKQKIPIQTLAQLIQQKQPQKKPNFNKTQYNPCEVFLCVLKSIKQNLYQEPQYEHKILQILNRYKTNAQYAKLLVRLILPMDQLFANLNQFYKDIALDYLKTQQKLDKQILFVLLQNLERILTQKKSQWADQKWIVNDYTKQQQIATILVPKMMASHKQFDNLVYVKLARICNILGVRNEQLGEFLLDHIRSQQTCRFKLKDILYVLRYLSQMDVFPYEYLYKNKRKFISTLQSYSKFSRKKSYEPIKLLEIIVKQNPMHCQQLIRRIQDIILQAVPSYDIEEVANVWYLCNRARFGIYTELIQKILDKIQAFVGSMKTRELCLLVKGFMGFRMLNDYNKRIQIILRVMKKELDPSRIYQHQILRLSINNLQNKAQKINVYS